MGYLLRHLVAVLIFPFTVIVLVPIWIARRYGVHAAWPGTALDVALAAAGAAVLALGLTLFGASLHHFFSRGRGTLAPWDPPRHLVVSGPYRYVRNPMISGVIFTLCGLALVLRSMPHAVWASTFLALNGIHIPLVEEPQLEDRFGEPYRRYRRHVGRFIPRRRPWENGDTQLNRK